MCICVGVREYMSVGKREGMRERKKMKFVKINLFTNINETEVWTAFICFEEEM